MHPSLLYEGRLSDNYITRVDAHCKDTKLQLNHLIATNDVMMMQNRKKRVCLSTVFRICRLKAVLQNILKQFFQTFSFGQEPLFYLVVFT